MERKRFIGTVVAGSEIMKIGSAGRRIEGRKNRSSRLEIQIWSAVNCHSREAGPWSMIVFVLLNVSPQRESEGAVKKGRRAPRTVRFPRRLVTESRLSMKKSAAKPAGEGSKPRWKFMECRSPLFLCSSVSPFSPLSSFVQTIPYFRARGNFNQGQNRWGSREKRTPFLFSQFVRLALVSNETRHCANSPGSELVATPLPPLPWLPDNTSPWMSSSSSWFKMLIPPSTLPRRSSFFDWIDFEKDFD